MFFYPLVCPCFIFRDRFTGKNMMIPSIPLSPHTGKSDTLHSFFISTQESMPVDHVRQVFAMSHVCRVIREGVRGIRGLPSLRIDGFRVDLLEHMRRKWPWLRFAIYLSQEEEPWWPRFDSMMTQEKLKQFWGVDLPEHQNVVEVCVCVLFSPLFFTLALSSHPHYLSLSFSTGLNVWNANGR